jgi:hypothetical protein
MRRLLLVVTAFIAASMILMPDEASAYWRGGWRGPGWGGYRLAGWGGYRPIYGPWAGAPIRVAPIVVLAPAPLVVGYPMAYGYGAPYPFYGGFYGYYRYGRCATDDGYGRRGSCDHP